ncbi:hypothetical protein Dimus_004069 [Dionaea muscipula]
MEGVKYTSDLVEAAISQAMMEWAALDGSSKVATHVPVGPHLTELLILDPNVSHTKGRKKEAKGKDKVQCSGRMKSGLEVAITRNKKLCGSCHKYRRHDKQNYPKNPNNQNKGAMEIDSSGDDEHAWTKTWTKEWTTSSEDV